MRRYRWLLLLPILPISPILPRLSAQTAAVRLQLSAFRDSTAAVASPGVGPTAGRGCSVERLATLCR
jgi:hypothetical protein